MFLAWNWETSLYVLCLIYLLKYCVMCFSVRQAGKGSQGNEQSQKRWVLKLEKELMLLYNN